jgi:hypothetical protein
MKKQISVKLELNKQTITKLSPNGKDKRSKTNFTTSASDKDSQGGMSCSCKCCAETLG